MQAFIKSFQAFRTLMQRNTISYDLCLDALEKESASVTLSGDGISGSMSGQWLILNSLPYRIGTVTPGKGSTKLSLEAPEAIFDRQLIYTEGAESIGGFLAREITENWIEQPDGVYAAPYLAVTNLDSTPFEPPETDENGIYSLLDYLRGARQRYNITLHFAIDGNRLGITVRRDPVQNHVLVLDDGHTKLESSAFSSVSLAKLTAVQPVDTGEVDEEGEKIYSRSVEDWYLSRDGTVSRTVPARRAEGEWTTVVLSETDDMEQAVSEMFAAGNSASHKLELRTDVPMAVNDHFRVRLGGEIFEGTVCSIRRKNGDRLPLYQSGELATTLPDKVRSLTASVNGSSTGSQLYAVGDVFITTRAGDPATLLGYGAWEQVQGRFLFAADASHPVRSKGGAAEHTLSTAELPKATIPVKYGNYNLVMSANVGSGTARTVPQMTTGSGNVTVELGGEGKAFSLLPPYLAVYVWIRKE